MDNARGSPPGAARVCLGPRPAGCASPPQPTSLGARPCGGGGHLPTGVVSPNLWTSLASEQALGPARLECFGLWGHTRMPAPLGDRWLRALRASQELEWRTAAAFPVPSIRTGSGCHGGVMVRPRASPWLLTAAASRLADQAVVACTGFYG